MIANSCPPVGLELIFSVVYSFLRAFADLNAGRHSRSASRLTSDFMSVSKPVAVQVHIKKLWGLICMSEL